MKTPRTLIAIVALFLAYAIQPALSAPGKGKGKGQDQAKEKAKAGPLARGKGKDKAKHPVPAQTRNRGEAFAKDSPRNEWRFQERDREVFHAHFAKYKQHPHGLPPGLAKKLQRGKPLPPGWQKKLREGWVIDDAMWSHFQPVDPAYLPASLHQPRDTGIYLIGDRLVRVHRPRREVIDLVRIASIARRN